MSDQLAAFPEGIPSTSSGIGAPSTIHLSLVSNSVAKPEASHPCLVCEKVFCSRSALLQHYDSHTELKRHRCSLCPKTFKNKQYLSYHVRKVHEKEIPAFCNVCHEEFPCVADLKIHGMSHWKTMPYQCLECGMCFSCLSDICEHQNNGSYRCYICRQKFRHNSLLKNHLTTHKNLKSHICIICSKAYKHKSSLLQHTRVHYATSTTSYGCNICGEMFFSKFQHNEHMKRHDDIFESMIDV